MKVRSRAISVTLAIGLFTTMGGQAERGLIEQPQMEHPAPFTSAAPHRFLQ